ncbi:apolipoprotein N-acyltransferase, partial [Thioclava sp. BHET1]
FGEYIPFGNLIYRLTGIQTFASDLGYGFTPGPGARVFDLGEKLGKVVPLICYETVFPQDVNAAPERASWLLQITNDGWFGTVSGPYQHLAQAELRTIEQGLPMVRDANTGVSAMIDAKGRIVKEMPMLAEGFIDARLPPALPRTLYSRTGDWPIGGILALLLLGLAWRRFPVRH